MRIDWSTHSLKSLTINNTTMKTCLFFLALSLAAGVYGQRHQGTVVYEVTMKLRVGPPGSPVHGVSQVYELLFNDQQSLYSQLPEAVTEGHNQGPGGMVIRPQNQTLTFFDFAGRRLVEQRELQDGYYLIQEPIEKMDWTLTEEEKTVLGHRVRRAYATKRDSSFKTLMENGVLKKETIVDSSRVEAWYAPGIPVPAGPAEFQGQLPGLVLEVRYANDSKVYQAKEFSPQLKAARLKEPAKGKRVSRAAYQKALEQQVAGSQPFMKSQQILIEQVP